MRKLLGMDNENELHPIYTDPIYAGLSALSKYLEEHVDHESFGGLCGGSTSFRTCTARSAASTTAS